MSFDADYKPKSWSKIVSNKKGYGVLDIMNDTHIYYERRDSTNEEMVDHFMIQKDALRTFGWKVDEGFGYYAYPIGIFVLLIILMTLSIFAYKR